MQRPGEEPPQTPALPALQVTHWPLEAPVQASPEVATVLMDIEWKRTPSPVYSIRRITPGVALIP